MTDDDIEFDEADRARLHRLEAMLQVAVTFATGTVLGAARRRTGATTRRRRGRRGRRRAGSRAMKRGSASRRMRGRLHGRSSRARLTGRPMRLSLLVDRLQCADNIAAYSPWRPCRSRKSTGRPPAPRRPQVPVSCLDRRARPPAIGTRGKIQPAPIRRPPPWHDAKPRQACAPSPCSRADRKTPHHSHHGGHRSERRISSCCSCFPSAALRETFGVAD